MTVRLMKKRDKIKANNLSLMYPSIAFSTIKIIFINIYLYIYKTYT